MFRSLIEIKFRVWSRKLIFISEFNCWTADSEIEQIQRGSVEEELWEASRIGIYLLCRYFI